MSGLHITSSQEFYIKFSPQPHPEKGGFRSCSQRTEILQLKANLNLLMENATNENRIRKRILVTPIRRIPRNFISKATKETQYPKQPAHQQQYDEPICLASVFYPQMSDCPNIRDRGTSAPTLREPISYVL